MLIAGAGRHGARVSKRRSAQQPAQPAVGEHPAPGLAGRAVLEGPRRQRHLADRVPAHRARLAGAPVHGEVLLLVGLELGDVDAAARARRPRPSPREARRAGASTSSALSAAAWRNGDSRAACRTSSEYALPTPAIERLVGEHRLELPPALARAARRGRRRRGRRRERRRRAGRCPGTSRRRCTTYSARRCSVPCSVMSMPLPPSSSTCSARGPRSVDRASVTRSRQRIHPALARWTTRWRSSAVMSRNLPCRVQPSTVRPTSACSGGSYVFSAPTERSRTAATTRPRIRSVRPRGQRADLGELRHASMVAQTASRSGPSTSVESNDLEVDDRRHRGQEQRDAAAAAARRALRRRGRPLRPAHHDLSRRRLARAGHRRARARAAHHPRGVGVPAPAHGRGRPLDAADHPLLRGAPPPRQHLPAHPAAAPFQRAPPAPPLLARRRRPRQPRRRRRRRPAGRRPAARVGRGGGVLVAGHRQPGGHAQRRLDAGVARAPRARLPRRAGDGDHLGARAREAGGREPLAQRHAPPLPEHGVVVAAGLRRPRRAARPSAPSARRWWWSCPPPSEQARRGAAAEPPVYSPRGCAHPRPGSPAPSHRR